MSLNPLKNVDAKTVVSVIAASYVTALVLAFIPALSPSSVVSKITGKPAA